MDTELKKLDSIRRMCTAILDEYAKLPQNQLIQASREMVSYARAAKALCDAIELGHRDSAKDVAYRELDSLMSSMMDIKKRMERRSVPMEHNHDEEKTEPKGLPPPTIPPPEKEVALGEVVKAIERLEATDDEKIGILLGIVLAYCKRAGKDLVEVVNDKAMQETLAKTGAVLDNKER